MSGERARAIPAAAGTVEAAARAAIFVVSVLIVLHLLMPGVSQLIVPIGVLACLALLLAFWRLSRVVQATVALLVAAGLIPLLRQGTPFAAWATGLTQMGAVFAFVLVIRLLELPLHHRGYDRAAGAVLRTAARGGRGAAAAGGAISYLLSCALSFGAVPIAYLSVKALGGGQSDWNEASVGGLVSRTFIAANTWSPISPVVVFALAATAVSWPTVLPWALLLSTVGVLLSPVGPRPRSMAPSPGISAGEHRRGVEAALFIGALILGIVIMELAFPRLGHVGATTAAVLMVVPLWEGLTGGWPSLGRRLVEAWRKDMPNWGEQYSLFTCGGLLVAAASQWGLSSGWLHGLTRLPPLAVLGLLPLAITLLALLGLYPMVTMVLAGTLLAPLGGAAWRVALAVTLILGSSIGFTISPFTGLTLLIGALTRRSSFEVGLRWNLAYGVALLAAGTALVVGFSYWLL